MTISVPSLHLAVPVRFFHFVPAKSFDAKPSLRSSFMSGRLYCLASTESNSCWSLPRGLGHLRLHPAVRQIREACVADHVARVARDHKAAWFVVKDSCVETLRLQQSLVVDHDELALVRPTVPLQEDPGALVAQQAAPGRCWRRRCCWTPAACSVLCQEEIVREVGGVGRGERVGGEDLRRGDRARACHVAADHAARRHSAACGREGESRLLQSSGPAEAAPPMVSVAPVPRSQPMLPCTVSRASPPAGPSRRPTLPQRPRP